MGQDLVYSQNMNDYNDYFGNLGREDYHYHSQDEVDLEEKMLKTAKKTGNMIDQYYMGQFYDQDEELDPDRNTQDDEAMKWYRLSAEQGYSEAQYNLAYLLDDNNDSDEAITWFIKSAEQGNEYAVDTIKNMQDSHGKMFNIAFIGNGRFLITHAGTDDSVNPESSILK